MTKKTQETTNETERHSSADVIQTIGKDAKPFQTFFTKFNNDWSMSFAGLLAYNLLMAMLPIAIALLAILGLILGGNQSLRESIIGQITGVFPGAAGQQNAIELASDQLNKDAGILGLIAILLAIFGGSRLFVALEGCLDIIYRVRPRTLLRQNMMAIGMLLLFIVLIPLMVFASVGPTFVFSILKNTPLNTIPGSGLLFSLGGILGGLIASFILFEAIYVVVPNQRISWRNSWRGAGVAAIAMELFLIVFPFYTTHLLGGYAGRIGFAVILLLFFYYFAVILMLGAEVNAFFFEKVQPLPTDLATFVSTMAGKLNRDLPEAEVKSHTDTGSAQIVSQRSSDGGSGSRNDCSHIT